jgi:flagellar biosynthesis/type III secretory pathway protein FliH
MSSSARAPDVEPFRFEQLQTPPPAAKAAMLPDPEALVAAAHAEADLIRARAYEEGVEQGRDEARRIALDEARRDLAPAAEALAGALAEILALREQTAQRMEAHAAVLALMLAEKIVVGALAVEPARVVDAVHGALRLLTERDRVTLLLNAEDMALVREAIDAGAGELAESAGLALHAERRVPRGSVMLRTAVGEIDARVETKLQRAREVVERELAR